MKVIGITGGIGSGKSTVAGFLADLGAVVIDADKVGHEVFAPNTEAWRRVVVAFGRQLLASDGEIDRKQLGKIVFNDPDALARLNQILHPRIQWMVQARLDEYQQQGIKVVVLEAILLIEGGWASLVDEVWVTLASQDTVLQRLEQRSGLTHEESLARIRNQLPAAERLQYADVVIDTDGSLDKVRETVMELWRQLDTPDNQQD